MNRWFTLGASLGVVLLISSATSGADLKSGPQPGKNLSPFSPLHCNGPQVDEKVCLV